MDDDPLSLFSPTVAVWFTERYGKPTPIQAQAWPVIARGEHTLMLAPTGSGKTLAAFLWSLNRLAIEPQHSAVPGIRVLYISPLKALNNDIERNLREPLHGIWSRLRSRSGISPAPRVAVRTGDTPSRDRAAMQRHPPDILITTPESLYLMLTTAAASNLFKPIRTVILDEIHTVSGNKRGVHLTLSLERLERLTSGPVQRIGLSATQRPLEEVARFLGGAEWRELDGERRLTPRPVQIVETKTAKPMDLQVIAPVADFREVGEEGIWPVLLPRVLDIINSHRSTLLFTNSRRTAERTADRLNALLAEQVTGRLNPLVFGDRGIFGIGDAERLKEAGVEPIRAHHGSMSREARLEMESKLKSGRLKALVGTGSLELGIDIGAIDLVVQIQSPRGIARGLQRVGRSGHRVGDTSVGRIFTTGREDLLEAAAVAKGMLEGDVESTHTPQNCLDVLAQQIVACVAGGAWTAAELFDTVRQAYGFQELTRSAFDSVLEMLIGRYAGATIRSLKPRLYWDRATDLLTPTPAAKMLAVRSGGTITDRGAYLAVLQKGNARLGELDEEFVFETQVGDVFTLGSSTWRVREITEDRVVVTEAPGAPPRMPFWRGDAPWREPELGDRVGRLRRLIAERIVTEGISTAAKWLADHYPLDDRSAQSMVNFIADQLEAHGAVATDREIVVETFPDPLGDWRLIIHCPLGGRINWGVGVILQAILRERYGTDIEMQVSDDGILYRLPPSDQPPPLDILNHLTVNEARRRLLEALPSSAIFGAQFRQNAARALLLPGLGPGKRTPFWLQRIRAKDLLQSVGALPSFPLIAETYRDCLRDVFDLERIESLIADIEKGEITVTAIESYTPSPVAANLMFGFVARLMYEWDAPRAERQLQAMSVNWELLSDLLGHGISLAESVRPEAAAAVMDRLQHTGAGWKVQNRHDLLQLLFELGDLTTEEIAARCEADTSPLLRELAAGGFIVAVKTPVAGGTVERWALTEDAPLIHLAFNDNTPPQDRDNARLNLLKRLLAAGGPMTLDRISARYAFPLEWLQNALDDLLRKREVVCGSLSPGSHEVEWCDRRNLEQIVHQNLAILRREIEPVPAAVLARALLQRQRVQPSSIPRDTNLLSIIQLLRGVSAPHSVWNSFILPSRCESYRPGDLDALIAGGETIWALDSTHDPHQQWIRFFSGGEGRLFLPDSPPAEKLSEEARQILKVLQAEGALFQSELRTATGLNPDRLNCALSELLHYGAVTNDQLGALAALSGSETGLGRSLPPAGPFGKADYELARLRAELPRKPHASLGRRPPPDRLREAKRRVADRLQSHPVPTASRSAVPEIRGRWSTLYRPTVLGPELPPDETANRQIKVLLDRYGLVNRLWLVKEGRNWRWSDLEKQMEQLELRGELRRGIFVEGLRGPQYAAPEFLEQLRTMRSEPAAGTYRSIHTLDPVFPILAPAALESGGLDLPLTPSLFRIAVLRDERPLMIWDVPTSTPGAINSTDGIEMSSPELVAAVQSLREGIGFTRSRLRIGQWNGVPARLSAGADLLATCGFVPEMDDMVWESDGN